METLKAGKKNGIVYLLISLVVLATVAEVFYGWQILCNIEPSGQDVWGHLYKADFMYRECMKGNLYPLFDINWYNGIETFRFWGPFSYYMYLVPMFVAGGNIVKAHRIFLSVTFFLGGIPWVIMGHKSGRNVVGTVMGIMWFFLPENTHIMFAYGNVPQIVTTMLIPYVILFLWLYLYKKSDMAALGLLVVLSICTVTHLMVTAIIGVSCLIFMVIDLFYNRELERKVSALIFMVFGILIMGIWFVPAVSGGILSTSANQAEIGQSFATELSVSLNPLVRFFNGYLSFYFGLSFLILSVFGLIASDSKHKAGYIFLLFTLLMSTPEAFNFVSKLPLGGLFWVERFVSVAYGFFFLAFMEWRNIKKEYAIGFFAVLIVDAMPFVGMALNNSEVFESSKEDAAYLVSSTESRTMVMDIGRYGSYMSYEIPANDLKYTYGWSWQGAITSDNIVLLNEALETNRYDYVFDRAIELGNDTVIVHKDFVPLYAYNKLIYSASLSGYELVTTGSKGYIFKLKDYPGQDFGVISDYDGLAIGKYASQMTIEYTDFALGISKFIDDYSYEELSSYKALFLTGFEYHNKADAEKLIQKVAQSGTRVVIDSSHLPSDPTIRTNYFMGVLSQDIHFVTHFPALSYDGRTIYPNGFGVENEEFGTQFISEVDNVIGTFYMGEKELAFLGTQNDYPNVYFLGLNIMYEAIDVNDTDLFEMLDELLTIDHDQMPSRQIVPIDVTTSADGITINAPADNVSTAIAYSDSFVPDKSIKDMSNLVVVNKGKTNISYSYPMFNGSLAVSVVGLIGCIGFAVIKKKMGDK